MPERSKGPIVDRRSLAVAIVAPALVVLSELLIGPQPSVTSVPYVALLVAKITLLAWCVGRWVRQPWLRWSVFCWSVVLVDMGAFAHFSLSSQNGEGIALVMAQGSALAFWGVLSTLRWVWRLAVALCAVTLIIPVAAWGFNHWGCEAWLPVLVMVVLLQIAGYWAMRGLGYRVAEQGAPPPDRNDVGVTNFGIGHMLVWSTALAPLLLIVQGQGWRADGFQRAWTALITDPAIAVCMALLITAGCVAVTTTVLSKRGVWIVFVGLVVLSISIGALSAWSMIRRMMVRGWGGWPYSMDDLVIDMHGQWLTWALLCYGVLAAMMVFFRASGYRLTRMPTSDNRNSADI